MRDLERMLPTDWSLHVSVDETHQHWQAKMARSYPTNRKVVAEGNTLEEALDNLHVAFGRGEGTPK